MLLKTTIHIRRRHAPRPARCELSVVPPASRWLGGWQEPGHATSPCWSGLIETSFNSFLACAAAGNAPARSTATFPPSALGDYRGATNARARPTQRAGTRSHVAAPPASALGTACAPEPEPPMDSRPAGAAARAPRDTASSPSPGLLGMPGWHCPGDLDPWVSSVLCSAARLRTDMQTRGSGLALLALLHDFELLLRNSHRPARYCADFHPKPEWRAAAAAALTRLDAAYDELYGDVGIYRDFEATRTAVQQLADAAAAGEQVCQSVDACGPGDTLTAQVLAELQRHAGLAAAGPEQWLQLCRAVHPLFLVRQRLRSGAAAAGPDASAGAAVVAAAAAAIESSAPLIPPVCGAAATEHVSCAGTPPDVGSEGGGSTPGGGEAALALQRLRWAVAQCSEALRRLAAGRPPLAPRLALHPAQYELLLPWLPGEEVRQGAEASGGGAVTGADAGALGGEGTGSGVGGDGEGALVQWVSAEELLQVWDGQQRRGVGGLSAAVEGGEEGEEEGEEEEKKADVVRSSSAGAQRALRTLVLYDGGAPLDLDELLLDSTDEALHLAAEMAAPAPPPEEQEASPSHPAAEAGQDDGRATAGRSWAPPGTRSVAGAAPDSPAHLRGVPGAAAGGLLPVVSLTPALAGRLLQLHPNEGLRWQVYQSGPLRQARALLAVLDRLGVLRRQLAEALGYSCWTDLVLHGGGGAAAGGGVGGVGGSALGGRTAIVRMLQELGQGLMSYGDRELEALRRDARRLGSRSRGGGLPPEADPLDPWNMPYVLQGLAQNQAASRYDTGWSAGYSDYFTPPALLQGSDALCRSLFGLALVGPLELEPGEAAGWVATAGQGQPPDGGARDGGARDGGADVMMKVAVVCCLTKRELGVLYFHLHGRLSEYPFTTLLRHGPMGQPGRPSDVVVVDAGDVRPKEEGAVNSPGGGSLPVVLVRLPYKPDPESECGGPESPYFLKAWLHELGHALHHIASAATCQVTSASELLTTPAPPPHAPLAGLPALSVPPPSARSAAVVPATDPEGDGSGGGHGDGDGGGWLLALLSGSSSPLDVREVPSHLMEHALRDPGCLGLLSRHARLDCPLPQRDCARLVAQLASSFTSTVGELQRLVAAALADQVMHGPDPAAPPPPTTTASVPGLQPAGAAAQSTVAGACRSLAAADGGVAVRAHLKAHSAMCSMTAYHRRAQLEDTGWSAGPGSIPHGTDTEGDAMVGPAAGESASAALPPPLLVAGPDVVHHLEAHAVLGGASYVYVSSRLFAAAVWQQHLQDHLPCGPPGASRTLRDSGSVVRSKLSGGLFVRRQLLEAGAHVPGIEVLRALLGRDAFIRVPCEGGGLGAELSDGDGNGSACEKAGPGDSGPMLDGEARWGELYGAAAESRELGNQVDAETRARAVASGKGGSGEAGGAMWVDGEEGELGPGAGGEEPLWKFRSGATASDCWVPDLAASAFQDVDLLG